MSKMEQEALALRRKVLAALVVYTIGLRGEREFDSLYEDKDGSIVLNLADGTRYRLGLHKIK